MNTNVQYAIKAAAGLTVVALTAKRTLKKRSEKKATQEARESLGLAN